MLKYQRDDEVFFNDLIQRAKELSENSLQQLLIFLKLLAEAMGDVKAAEVVARFADIVRVANVRCHGRVVKQIGDGLHLALADL